MAWTIDPETGKLVRVDIPTEPPPGHYKVVNIFVNKDTGKLVIYFDDET